MRLKVEIETLKSKNERLEFENERLEYEIERQKDKNGRLYEGMTCIDALNKMLMDIHSDNEDANLDDSTIA